MSNTASEHRPVVAVIGDGAMQMNGMNVLISVAKSRKQSANHPRVAIVLNDRDYAKAFSSTVLSGDPKEAGVLTNAAKEVLSTILPGRS